MENKDLDPKKGTVGRLPPHRGIGGGGRPLTEDTPTCAQWLHECAQRVVDCGLEPNPDQIEQHVRNVKELLRAISEIWGHSFVASAIGAKPSSFGVSPILDATTTGRRIRAAVALGDAYHKRDELDAGSQAWNILAALGWEPGCLEPIGSD